jgi:hypothetical protein
MREIKKRSIKWEHFRTLFQCPTFSTLNFPWESCHDEIWYGHMNKRNETMPRSSSSSSQLHTPIARTKTSILYSKKQFNYTHVHVRGVSERV